MDNSLSRNSLRNGQLIDGFEETPFQSCSLSYEPLIGPMLSIPYIQGERQFIHTERWFMETPPESLLFQDNLGTVTLTGLKVQGRAGAPFVLGRLRAEVAVFGQPTELKSEYRFETLTSRIDGLQDFTNFSSITSKIEPHDMGHRVTAVVDPRERIALEHGTFHFTIRATSPWTSVRGRSFSADSGAVVETTATGGALAEQHLTAQRAIRALLIIAMGKALYWREHTILDAQFPVWMLDGSTRMPAPCKILLKQTIRDTEQPEPDRADSKFPLFQLTQLGETGIRKWLDLYHDPLFRRAIEPVVEVINGASRFLEPQVLLTALALDAMGYYRDVNRTRNAALYKHIKSCLDAVDLDFSSIGPIEGIARAIANTNNNLKHPDRLERPDPIHMSLVARLSIAVLRLQVIDLLGLATQDLRGMDDSEIYHAVSDFERNGVTIDEEGRFISS